MAYAYTPIFNDRLQLAVTRAPPPAEADRTSPQNYVFDDAMRLRVNLALATGRPLLVRGPSGVGKSSLARAVASRAGWNYCERTIVSRTQAQDLFYEFDQLKRLQAAQRSELTGDERPYLRPGPLFWGFNASGAVDILMQTGRDGLIPADLILDQRWVVLIDEIDKADPDVPNNLLVPFGRLEFEIPELGINIRADSERMPLLFLTTNEERDLPPAFLRRCIELVVEEPNSEQLTRVATAHGLDNGEIDLKRLAKYYEEAPRPKEQRRNTAEFLDFVRAWRHLELTGDEETRTAVLEAVSGRFVR